MLEPSDKLPNFLRISGKVIRIKVDIGLAALVNEFVRTHPSDGDKSLLHIHAAQGIPEYNQSHHNGWPCIRLRLERLVEDWHRTLSEEGATKVMAEVTRD